MHGGGDGRREELSPIRSLLDFFFKGGAGGQETSGWISMLLVCKVVVVMVMGEISRQ